jgi:hypothetical protein
MVVSEILSRIDDTVHVSFHEISYDIDIFIAGLCWGTSNIDEGNYVLMVEKFEELDFTHDSFGVNKIFKCLWYFFNRNFSFRVVVVCRTNYTVCAMTDLLNVLKLFFDYECRA